MKKKGVFVFVFIIVFTLTVITEAKVAQNKDPFDNSVITYSLIRGKGAAPLNSVFFAGSDKVYSLSFNMIEDDWWFFSPKITEVKFNGDPEIYEWQIDKTNSKISQGPLKSSKYYLYTTCDILMTSEMLDKIREATAITFRIHFTNQPSLVFDVPKKTLAEWKQVINTTE